MKFGVFGPLHWSESATAGDAGEGASFEPFLLAEEQGYDAVWLAEQPRSKRRSGPAIHLRASQLAARTRRIRIGLALSLPSSLHPLRLAEEIAMLDIVSAGRVACCLGRADQGYDPAESASAGEPRQRDLDEQVEILRRAWQGKPFAFAGEQHRFSELVCLPTPVQQPHPPLSVAALSPAAIEWAAARQLCVMADAFSPADRIERGRRVHAVAAERAGVADPAQERAVLRHVHVGESTKRAHEVAAPRLRALYRSLLGAGDDHAAPARRGMQSLLQQEGHDAERDPQGCVEFLLERCAIVGDAARCRDVISELRACTPLDSLITCHAFGELPREAEAASQRRFIDEVAPAFA